MESARQCKTLTQRAREIHLMIAAVQLSLSKALDLQKQLPSESYLNRLIPQTQLLLSQAIEVKKNLSVVVPLIEEYQTMKQASSQTNLSHKKFLDNNSILQYGLQELKALTRKLDLTKEVVRDILQAARPASIENGFADLLRSVSLGAFDKTLLDQVGLCQSVQVVANIDDLFEHSFQEASEHPTRSTLPPIKSVRMSGQKLNIGEVKRRMEASQEAPVPAQRKLPSLRLDQTRSRVMLTPRRKNILMTHPSSKSTLTELYTQPKVTKELVENMVKNFIRVKQGKRSRFLSRPPQTT